MLENIMTTLGSKMSIVDSDFLGSQIVERLFSAMMQ